MLIMVIDNGSLAVPPAAPGTREAGRKAYASPHGGLRELEGSKCQALEGDMVLIPFMFSSAPHGGGNVVCRAHAEPGAEAPYQIKFKIALARNKTKQPTIHIASALGPLDFLCIYTE